MLASRTGRKVQGLAVAGAVVASAAGIGGAVAGPSAAPAGFAGDSARVARNVIFIQGDGMGIAHREFIRLATKGHRGELAMDSLRYAGWTQRATSSSGPSGSGTTT